MSKVHSINEDMVGTKIVFVGFTSDDIPEDGALLQDGESYEVSSVSVGDKENEDSLTVTVSNPKHDPKKRKSKANWATKDVPLFGDEFDFAEEETLGKEDAAEVAIPYKEVKKGDSIAVVDKEGEEISGVVTKKTATSLEIEADDGTKDLIAYKKAEIAAIFPAGEAEAVEDEKEEEVEKEPAKPAKKKATAKKTAAKKKATAKKATAKKAPAKKEVSKKEESSEDNEDLEGMIILTEEEEDEEILSLVNDTDDLCDLAMETADEAVMQEYKLGGILYHVRTSGAYREVNENEYDVKKGFALYVENELRIGYRKAMYLIDIYAKFNKLGLGSEYLARMGWTKATVVLKHLTEDNAEELAQSAEESTVEELKDTIKESFGRAGKEGREVVRKVTISVRMVEDAAATVENYLEQAMDQLDTTDLSVAFEHIVTEWAAEHLDVSTKPKSSRGKGGRAKK